MVPIATVAPCPADDEYDAKTRSWNDTDIDDDDENDDDDDPPVHYHDPEEQSCSASRMMPTDETILSGSVTVMACNRTKRRFPFRRARGSSRQTHGEGHPLLLVSGVSLLLASAVSIGLLVYIAFDPVLMTKPSSETDRFRGYVLNPRPTASPSLDQLSLTIPTVPPTLMPTILSNKSSNYGHFSLTGGGKTAVVVDAQPTMAPTTEVNNSNSTSLDANMTNMPSTLPSFSNEPSISGTENAIPQPTIPPTQNAALEPTRMDSESSPSKPPTQMKLPTTKQPASSTTRMPSIQKGESQIQPPTNSPTTLLHSRHTDTQIMSSDSASQPALAPTTTSSGRKTGVPTLVDTASITLVPTSGKNLEPSLNIFWAASPPPKTVPSDKSTFYAGTQPADCPDLPSNAPPLPGKKGIGMTLRPEDSTGSWAENLPKLISLNPYWNHRWGPELIDAQPDDIEFVPMVFGANAAARNEVLQTLMNNPKIKRILGFNEPDQKSQSNVNVSTALTKWSKLEETGLSLVSPSAADPLDTWMEKFMSKIEEECRRVDWIGVHWYGPAVFSSFTSQMREIHAKFGGRPLLLTEFAVADHKSEERGFNRFNQTEVLEFMKKTLPWLEEQDWIAGYAWFSFKQSKLKGSSSALFEEDDGQLTALGRFYASVTTENPRGDQTIVIT